MAKPKTEPQLVSIQTRDSINIKLTQDEISERAILSVQVAGEFDKADDEFKLAKKDWTKRLESITSRLKTLRRTVETGEEYREVECQREFDIASGKTWLVYEGRKYFERPCTPDEVELLRTGSLFDDADGENHGEG